MKARSSLIAWIGVSFLAALSSIHAADGVWIADANGNWGDENNRQDAIIADGAGHTSNFGSTFTATRMISLGADRTIGNILFASDGQNMVMTGNTLTFADAGDALVFHVDINIVRVASVFAGNEGLVKNGAGILSLDLTSTSISGPVVVNQGELRIQRNNIPGGVMNIDCGTALIGTLLYNANTTTGVGILDLNGGTALLPNNPVAGASGSRKM